ncbi:hypothetical protein EJB05_07501 [Eragrostis curvula]|uniref:Uncharacterized protein n=1 Tax=Eragrostis curvula TaxID=38414 RepID=A0A5J9WIU1_9POAL|nr:hypothetical protein EJB05_07501 [Eragrostis curvula]
MEDGSRLLFLSSSMSLSQKNLLPSSTVTPAWISRPPWVSAQGGCEQEEGTGSLLGQGSIFRVSTQHPIFSSTNQMIKAQDFPEWMDGGAVAAAWMCQLEDEYSSHDIEKP